MNQQTEKRPLLTDALPAFETELRQLLIEKDEPELTCQMGTRQGKSLVTDTLRWPVLR
jgi:hypothetical protein